MLCRVKYFDNLNPKTKIEIATRRPIHFIPTHFTKRHCHRILLVDYYSEMAYMRIGLVEHTYFGIIQPNLSSTYIL